MNRSRISARVRGIKPSPSSAAADRASILKREGKSIVSLVVGEPDFDTPAHIRLAATKAMERGATRYTMLAGSPELRQAIAAKLQRENGLTYAASDIIVTNGAKSGIYSALQATVEPRCKDGNNPTSESCTGKVRSLAATAVSAGNRSASVSTRRSVSNRCSFFKVGFRFGFMFLGGDREDLVEAVRSHGPGDQESLCVPASQ